MSKRASKTSELSQKQIEILTLRFSCKSVAETCRKGKISEKAYYNWMKQAAFKKLYDSKRKEILESGFEQLSIALSKATEKVTQLISCQDKSIALNAAKTIIVNQMQIQKIEKLQLEIERIQELLQGQNE